jgi:hypothetical protein
MSKRKHCDRGDDLSLSNSNYYNQSSAEPPTLLNQAYAPPAKSLSYIGASVSFRDHLESEETTAARASVAIQVRHLTR